jgi:hypothetical protein
MLFNVHTARPLCSSPPPSLASYNTRLYSTLVINLKQYVWKMSMNFDTECWSTCVSMAYGHPLHQRHLKHWPITKNNKKNCWGEKEGNHEASTADKWGTDYADSSPFFFFNNKRNKNEIYLSRYPQARVSVWYQWPTCFPRPRLLPLQLWRVYIYFLPF